MSERSHRVSPQDKLSKIVHRRCKQVADFIEGDEVTTDNKKRSDETSNREDDVSVTISDNEEEEDADFNNFQHILTRMEVQDTSVNKTFSEEKLRDIERRNAILMEKLIKNSQRPNQYKCVPIPNKVASAAINRRRQQEKINRDNLVMHNVVFISFQQFY